MTTRPRQWLKNLLVFAAPLAGASLGHRFGYALVAMFAFGCASAAVSFVNDVADVERDRRHRVKRNRPIALGALPEQHAIVLAVLSALFAVGAGVVIREPLRHRHFLAQNQQLGVLRGRRTGEQRHPAD
jgi:decaprenyl-phosphate phosphoribosyltransferase